MRDSPVMADKPKFFLAPSRLGRPAGTDDSQTAKPKFTGLKESKLGVLAESKLSSSAASVTGSNFGVKSPEKSDTKAPVTFQFAPLTKPSEEQDNKSKTGGVENKNPNEKKEFVFGQNLTARVENVETKSESDTKVEDAEVPAEDVKDPPSSESTKDDLLFSTSVSPKGDEDSGGKANSKTLSEAAAEYTETHSNKRKYDVVDVVTGEEEESNVLKANVKLYIFDSDKKNWVERGRGGIRLNDDPSSTPGHLRSRLVMRTAGSLRVILNTKLFPNMICEKANEKNVRISAMEENVLRVFLISGSPKDADKIFTALEYRINQLTSEENDKEEVTNEEDGTPAKIAKTSDSAPSDK